MVSAAIRYAGWFVRFLSEWYRFSDPSQKSVPLLPCERRKWLFGQQSWPQVDPPTVPTSGLRAWSIISFIKNAPENREVFSLADEWR
jgi:hypothetical protein